MSASETRFNQLTSILGILNQRLKYIFKLKAVLGKFQLFLQITETIIGVRSPEFCFCHQLIEKISKNSKVEMLRCEQRCLRRYSVDITWNKQMALFLLLIGLRSYLRAIS